MAVKVLTTFPQSFVAGDTLRVEISDGDYPSSGWSLKVLFDGPVRKLFSAGVGAGDVFNLVVSADDSAKLLPGTYSVSFVFTETSSSERASVPFGAVEVLQDPIGAVVKTIARRTLEAMENALEKLSAGSNLTVNFNGQSFTKKNLKELQDAIARQRAIVDAESGAGDLLAGTRRGSGIGVRFA